MIAPAFAPAFFSEALVNSKLALAILDAGWELSVYAAPGGGDLYSSGWGDPWTRLERVRRDTPTSSQPQIGQVARSTDAAERLLSAIRTGHPVSSARWAERTARAALAEHRARPFDLVLSRSTSCVAHLPALLFRRALGDDAPVWVANWNDPPGHRFPPPYQSTLSRWHRFFQDRYLRTAARSADVNTFPSAQLRDYLAAPLGLEDENLPAGRRGLVIPHIGIGYRPNRAHPREPNAFRICHAGNLSAERDPTPLFRALQKLAERNPDLILEFEIIGQINSAFETAAAELGIEKMLRIVPGMPYLACLDRLASADLQVLIEAPCDRGVFLPSKLADYNEVGQPILALSPRHGAVRDLIDQHGFGVFAANDSDEQVEAALAQCLEEHRETGASHPRKSALAKMAELIAPARVVEQIRLAALEAPMNSSLVMQ